MAIRSCAISVWQSVCSGVALASAGLLLTGCSYARPNPTPPFSTGQYGPGDPTVNRVGGDGGLWFGFGNPVYGDVAPVSRQPGVNVFLWRGALETLGTFPLTTADPFGGVIVTDWYSPPGNPVERFKDTAYIGDGMRSGGDVRINVFHQVNRGGVWTDAPVSQVLRTDMQQRVLDRARLLRGQSSMPG